LRLPSGAWWLNGSRVEAEGRFFACALFLETATRIGPDVSPSGRFREAVWALISQAD